MKGLEALEKVKRTIKAELAELDLMGFEKSDKYNYLEQLLNELTAIEKFLKALEIIKEKRIDLCILTDCDNVNEYNKSLGNFRPVEDRLTYEEFDLLKEVLGC